MSEWISVEDRLPKKQVVVLVCVDYHYHRIEKSILTGHFTGRGTFMIGPNSVGIGQKSDIEVTHWMPLPEPPSE